MHWGAFPADYARYNDVSLDYLWPKIAAFQTEYVQRLEGLRNDLEDDAQAACLLDEIVENEWQFSTEIARATILTLEVQSNGRYVSHFETRRTSPRAIPTDTRRFHRRSKHVGTGLATVSQ